MMTFLTITWIVRNSYWWELDLVTSVMMNDVNMILSIRNDNRCESIVVTSVMNSGGSVLRSVRNDYWYLMMISKRNYDW